MLLCWSCRTEKPEEEFYGNGQKDRRCKECARRRATEYAAAHREERAAYSRKWHKEHPGYIREYQRKRRRRMGVPELHGPAPDSPHLYRPVAEAALGRRLKRGEHVHHINMVDTDHGPENLWVCSNSKHHEAHWSLRHLVKPLLERGVILFDRGAGVYRLAATG